MKSSWKRQSIASKKAMVKAHKDEKIINLFWKMALQQNPLLASRIVKGYPRMYGTKIFDQAMEIVGTMILRVEKDESI